MPNDTDPWEPLHGRSNHGITHTPHIDPQQLAEIYYFQPAEPEFALTVGVSCTVLADQEWQVCTSDVGAASVRRMAQSRPGAR